MKANSYRYKLDKDLSLLLVSFCIVLVIMNTIHTLMRFSLSYHF
jgi:hypothetical protein